MISATSQPSRYIHSKIFSSLLNHIIKNSDFQLNEAEFKKLSDNQMKELPEIKKQELQVLEILNLVRLQLHSEVEKSWMKLNEYFLFWLDFYTGGPAQEKYMYSNQMMEQFMDFFLDKDSLLKLYPKQHKHQIMGNHHINPDFRNLAKLLCLMITKSQTKSFPGHNPY